MKYKKRDRSHLRKVSYFGLDVYIPINAKYLAVNEWGEMYSFNIKPEESITECDEGDFGSWHISNYDDRDELDFIANVILEEPWNTTLKAV